MVVETVASDRLDDLFRVADIDDITYEPFADESEQVVVVFTERVTGDNHMVAASTISAAVDEAVRLFEERQAVRQLRASGLTGSDIADLVGRPDLADLDDEFDNSPEGDAWRRGYQAGVLETGELYADALARRLEARPAAAAVGEPIDGEVPVEIVGRAIPITEGAYLALILPTPVARA